MKPRGSTSLWVGIIALMAVTGGMAWYQISGLPDLGMVLGPDLTVRQVAMEREPLTEGQPFQRGDQLTHLEGISLDDLRELRSLLPPLVADADPPEFDEDAESVDELEELELRDAVVLDYQMLRPLHRFTVELQGEPPEPGQLPPGIEPGDRLVTVDGGFHPEVGPEGIRSIAASRPEAVLGIERPDAVFSGQLKVEEPSNYPAIVVVFLMALMAVVGLWRGYSRSVGSTAAYLVALETICIAWLFLLVFGFQWVLGDWILAGGVIAALVLCRPLSILARQQGGAEETVGGFASLGIGAVAGVVLIGLMVGGYVPSAEEALHGAAITAGLFIVYELVADSLESGSVLKIGERGGYLAGVVALGLFTCVVALWMAPVPFREERWRWFAVFLPSLLWFGDVLYTMKYGHRSATAEIAERTSRQRLIGKFFREMALEMPHTDLRLVGRIDGGFVELAAGDRNIQRRVPDDALRDAVDILITENTRIPLPEGGSHKGHPMTGIAQSMEISLALMLPRRRGSLQVDGDDAEVALVGMRESSEGDVPSYASVDTLRRARELWRGPVASAVMVEMLIGLAASTDAPEASGEPAPAVQQKLEKAEREAQQQRTKRESAEEQRDELQRKLRRQQGRHRIYRLATRPDYPAPTDDDELLEPELIDGLEYLLETTEPIALAGPPGAGKGFVAHRAHHMAGGSREEFLAIDRMEPNAADILDEIIGEAGGGRGKGAVEGFDGSLLVRSAERCDDSRILALCHQCEEHEVRLFLAFSAADAEQRSVLEDRPETLRELLGPREVIVPRFVNRPTIRMAMLDFWLAYWAKRYEKRIEGFSRMAADALDRYGYPGEIAEAKEIVRLAVLATEHDVVDREKLPI